MISRTDAQMPPGMPFGMMPAVSAPGEGAPEGPGEALVDVSKQRDPFWPVGYVPKKVLKPRDKGFIKTTSTPESVPEPVRIPLWDEARKKLDIRGMSLIHDKNSKTPKYIAMVAGKLVETGDVVIVRHEERVYRWRVVDISEEGVSLQKLDVRGE
jgi:hypothetical protein